MNDRRPVGLLERLPQQRVGLRRRRRGFEEIALVEHDRIDLVGGDELDDVDFAALLRRERFEVFVREYDGALAVVEGLVDVGVVDDLAADLAASLIADAAAVGVMHLMEGDVMVLRRAVDLHRHVDQAERDGTTPDRSHPPIVPPSAPTGNPRTRRAPRRTGAAALVKGRR